MQKMQYINRERMPGRACTSRAGGRTFGFLAVTDDVSELTKAVEGKSRQKETAREEKDRGV